MEYLEQLRTELLVLGESAVIRSSGEGPFLHAAGHGPHLSELIRVRRTGAEVRGLWSWGEALPADITEAARAIRRVINPAVA